MRAWVLGLAGVLLAVTAAAQEPPAPSAYSLSVSGQEAVIIGQALQKLPYEVAAPLILKLQTQINEQSKAPPMSAAEKEAQARAQAPAKPK